MCIPMSRGLDLNSILMIADVDKQIDELSLKNFKDIISRIFP